MSDKIDEWNRKVRTLYTWSHLYLGFKVAQVRSRMLPEKQRPAYWKSAHSRFAQAIWSNIADLRGWWVKVGQFLSTRADLLPDEYVAELAKVQDMMPTSPFPIIKKIVETELQAPLESLFEFFEEKALASASIGQVHRARLRNGDDVVVKVQHPNVDKLLSQDMALLSQLSWAFGLLERGLSFTAVLEEWQKQAALELDFTYEASSQARVRDAMIASGIDVKVPLPYAHLTTRKVMVMEFIDGFKCTDQESLKKYNVNVDELCSQVTRSFAYQIHIDGMFNGDPHPGNIMVEIDKVTGKPRPVLIDWGLVKEFNTKERLAFARTITSVANVDVMGLMQAFQDMGFKFKAKGGAGGGNGEEGGEESVIAVDPEMYMDAVSILLANQNGGDEVKVSVSEEDKALIANQMKNFDTKKASAAVEQSNPLDDWPKDIIFFLRVASLLHGLSVQLKAKVPFFQILLERAEEAVRTAGSLDISPCEHLVCGSAPSLNATNRLAWRSIFLPVGDPKGWNPLFSSPSSSSPSLYSPVFASPVFASPNSKLSPGKFLGSITKPRALCLGAGAKSVLEWKIQKVLLSLIEQGEVLGCQVSVWHMRRNVCEVALGVMGTYDSRPVTPLSLFTAFSLCNILLVATILHLASKNKLKLSDCVGEHWDAYIKKNKRTITIQDHLTFQAGVHNWLPSNLSLNQITNYKYMIRVLEEAEPVCKRGRCGHYPFYTISWVLNHVIAQVTKYPTAGRYLRAHCFKAWKLERLLHSIFYPIPKHTTELAAWSAGHDFDAIFRQELNDAVRELENMDRSPAEALSVMRPDSVGGLNSASNAASNIASNVASRVASVAIATLADHGEKRGRLEFPNLLSEAAAQGVARNTGSNANPLPLRSEHSIRNSDALVDGIGEQGTERNGERNDERRDDRSDERSRGLAVTPTRLSVSRPRRGSQSLEPLVERIGRDDGQGPDNRIANSEGGGADKVASENPFSRRLSTGYRTPTDEYAASGVGNGLQDGSEDEFEDGLEDGLRDGSEGREDEGDAGAMRVCLSDSEVERDMEEISCIDILPRAIVQLARQKETMNPISKARSSFAAYGNSSGIGVGAFSRPGAAFDSGLEGSFTGQIQNQSLIQSQSQGRDEGNRESPPVNSQEILRRPSIMTGLGEGNGGDGLQSGGSAVRGFRPSLQGHSGSFSGFPGGADLRDAATLKSMASALNHLDPGSLDRSRDRDGFHERESARNRTRARDRDRDRERRRGHERPRTTGRELDVLSKDPELRTGAENERENGDKSEGKNGGKNGIENQSKDELKAGGEFEHDSKSSATESSDDYDSTSSSKSDTEERRRARQERELEASVGRARDLLSRLTSCKRDLGLARMADSMSGKTETVNAGDVASTAATETEAGEGEGEGVGSVTYERSVRGGGVMENGGGVGEGVGTGGGGGSRDGSEANDARRTKEAEEEAKEAEDAKEAKEAKAAWLADLRARRNRYNGPMVQPDGAGAEGTVYANANLITPPIPVMTKYVSRVPQMKEFLRQRAVQASRFAKLKDLQEQEVVGLSALELFRARPHLLDPLLFDSPTVYPIDIPCANARVTARGMTIFIHSLTRESIISAELLRQARLPTTLDKSLEARVATGGQLPLFGLGFQLLPVQRVLRSTRSAKQAIVTSLGPDLTSSTYTHTPSIDTPAALPRVRWRSGGEPLKGAPAVFCSVNMRVTTSQTTLAMAGSRAIAGPITSEREAAPSLQSAPLFPVVPLPFDEAKAKAEGATRMQQASPPLDSRSKGAPALSFLESEVKPRPSRHVATISGSGPERNSPAVSTNTTGTVQSSSSRDGPGLEAGTGSGSVAGAEAEAAPKRNAPTEGRREHKESKRIVYGFGQSDMGGNICFSIPEASLSFCILVNDLMTGSKVSNQIMNVILDAFDLQVAHHVPPPRPHTFEL